MEKESFKYYAFISYSHRDKKTAQKLQKFLQNYHLPSKLQKSHPALPKNLKPIFIDELSLVSTGSLQESLKRNLDSSNYLIVICSPHSAGSSYVNEEVDYFISIGRKAHIIPLIADGVPHSGGDTECFPPALLELQKEYELLGIDLKKFGFRDAFLRVIATMLGLDLDNFISWEARERRKRIAIYTSMAAVFAVSAGLFLWNNLGFFHAMLYDTKTKNEIAIMYYEGRGVEQDYAKALEWYQRAAEDGDAWSQTVTGLMYKQGLGTEKDYAKALEWFGKAALNGYAKAQSNIAVMYYRGEGVSQDYVKAAKYYEEAAVNGDSDAQINIGIMYYEGLGVERDYVKAAQWLEKVALSGNVKAQFTIGRMYYEGLGVEQDYAKSAQWFEKAAVNGDVTAQNIIGLFYQGGIGVERDYVKAVQWFEKSALKGHAIAQYNLGYMYENGLGVTQDYAKALEWYEKSAANGNTDVQDGIDRIKRLM